MKRCSCCGELKPDSEFYRNKKAKDGLCTICKQCAHYSSKGYTHQEIRKLNAKDESCRNTVGGLRINILNYTKQGEYKFNISYIGEGRHFQTNNQTEFLRALQIHLGRAA